MCNNLYRVNAVKEFWAFCILSTCWLVGWLVGGPLLLRDFGPYEITFMMCVVITVHMPMTFNGYMSPLVRKSPTFSACSQIEILGGLKPNNALARDGPVLY
jgi:hypothetical protein